MTPSLKVKVLVDVKVELEPPSHLNGYWRDAERKARALEGWVSELNDFLGDHRSQDTLRINVERVYEEQCAFCHREWEEDDAGRPVCCGKAVDAWEAQRQEVTT